MTEAIKKLEQLVKTGTEYILKFSESELTFKSTPKKWSKKEIMGHLIDSGINNLQRFTEIQFDNKPYKVKKYNQDELVKANDYQNSEIKEVIEFWNSINNRILFLMKKQTENTLNYKIELEEDDISDLRFLMNDYVIHIEHHLNQIMK
ncbi:DinB family protein [Sphingobacterium sp. SRCM116780]|uniref:DinB family protein n=1 Tax=Sphingobacterium sp. SRCM116780 TaxID=2907623 RepID=UPI001F2A683E|nr:DinB family protein [Sphingobacterium sp. SRCM116780]UIR56392.1 DinB family protein [Sphingobacterium sp. SRCM116780]